MESDGRAFTEAIEGLECSWAIALAAIHSVVKNGCFLLDGRLLGVQPDFL